MRFICRRNNHWVWVLFLTAACNSSENILVEKGTEMIKKDTAYPLNLPDNPHSSPYTDPYSKVWFRIQGGPQGAEYLHRGQRSLGCVAVNNGTEWSKKVHFALVNSRAGDGKTIGKITRKVVKTR